MQRANQEGRIFRNAQFLDHECRRPWLCEDLRINLGMSAEECRNKRLHLLNACVAEFKDVGGLTMRHNS